MPGSDLIPAILSIVVIDLILSGDNAVVIGMAARRLSPENRRRAVIFGGVGAVGLRILFTVMATLLLDLSYIRAIGGLLLLWIAFKLLRPQDHAAGIGEAGSLGEAIRTIVLADVVMSLDNILAVGAAAEGELGLLLFGLLLSIPILLVGSEMVARVLGRFPILVYVGAFVLIRVAVNMVLEDPIVHDRYEASTPESLLLTALATAVVVVAAWWGQRRSPPAAHEPAPLHGQNPIERIPAPAAGDGRGHEAERRPEPVRAAPPTPSTPEPRR